MTEIQLVKTAQGHFIALNDNEVGAGEIVVAKYSASNQRTLQQNNSLHLYCGQLATACNDAGYDKHAVYKLMKDGYQIPWTKDSVKTDLWHPIQKAMFNTTSTRNLEKKQVSDIWRVLDGWTGEKLNISIPFPSRFG
jgi:hypothetical protein